MGSGRGRILYLPGSINYAWLRLVGLYVRAKGKIMSGAEEFSFQVERCQNCVRGELSLAYCPICKRQLCNECHQQHKKQVDTAEHETVESPEAEEIRKKYQCSSHKGQPLNYYCTICSKPACDYCYKTQCSGHYFMVEDNVKKDIKTRLVGVKKKKKDFESYREHITSVSQQHTNAITRCEGEVDNAIDELIQKLKEQRALFHDKLRGEKARITERDGAQLQYVEGILEKLQKSVDDTEKLLASNTAKVMVHRDSTLVNLEGMAEYSWKMSKVIPLGWQLKNKPIDEYASKFGKLIPKPREEDIVVEGLDKVPRVGFTNDFTITVDPAHQCEGYAVIKEVVVKIKQRPYQKQTREEEIMYVINEPNDHHSKWSVSYFLRTHGEISIEVSVCSIPAAGSPFKLKTVEREMLTVGTKVVRGRDWMYGTQDGGEGCVGKVVEVRKDGRVMVKWDSQKKPKDYRWGDGDHYDLKVVD